MRALLILASIAFIVTCALTPSTHESEDANVSMHGDAPWPIAVSPDASCPGQYSEFLPPPRAQFFLRCWGHRGSNETQGTQGITINLSEIPVVVHHTLCGMEPAPGGYCL